MKRAFLVWFLSAAPAMAFTLSGHLTSYDIDRITELVGTGAASRLLRSAEPYETWPGIKIGLETDLVPTRDINSLGDGTGSVPSFSPQPRLYLCKGLPFNIDLVLNLFPTGIINTPSTVGGLLKWTYYTESENWASGAIYAGFTHINAYEQTFEGTNWEFGALFSKDYVRLKPFFGAGVLLTRASISPSLVLASTNTSSRANLHAFLGTEIEMPANVTFQIDLMNLGLQGSLLIAKHF